MPSRVPSASPLPHTHQLLQHPPCWGPQQHTFQRGQDLLAKGAAQVGLDRNQSILGANRAVFPKHRERQELKPPHTGPAPHYPAQPASQDDPLTGSGEDTPHCTCLSRAQQQLLGPWTRLRPGALSPLPQGLPARGSCLPDERVPHPDPI